MVAWDLRVLLSPEVIKYIATDKGELVFMLGAVKESGKKIQGFRLDKQLELLKSETSFMPQDFQNRLAELVEGVWDEDKSKR